MGALSSKSSGNGLARQSTLLLILLGAGGILVSPTTNGCSLTTGQEIMNDEQS